MTCYRPTTCYKSIYKNSNGKHSLVFQIPNQLEQYVQIQVPCGGCIGCRIDRSRQWAQRCMHESELHEKNSFITLTYNDENLPEGGTLVKEDFVKFMKRLRKYCKVKVRFFHCGEYGDKTDRPHHHACIFGWDFPDRELLMVRDEIKLYRSAQLEKLWPYGHSIIGDVTYESAAYVARYVIKKITGKAAESHYRRIDPDTGEIIQLVPEYVTMSRRPGIGKEYYKKYKSDFYPKDFSSRNGNKLSVPKYYDKLLEQEDAELLQKLKEKRLTRAKENVIENTRKRLKVRRELAEIKAKKLVRKEV